MQPHEFLAARVAHVKTGALKVLLDAVEADLDDHWTLYQNHPELPARIEAINEARRALGQKPFKPPRST